MQPTQASRLPAAEPDVMPESGFRTLISFLIFLHLFAVGVGTLSTYNFSHIERQLRDVPPIRPYLQLLGMDVPYIGLYSLTFGEDNDRDHFFTVVEVDPKKPAAQLSTVQVPDTDIHSLDRVRRYQQLARQIVLLKEVENEAYQALIVTAVGIHELKTKGWERCRVRCIGHKVPLMERFRSTTAQERDSLNPLYYETIYEADVWISKRGEPKIQKIESASDSAPVATPRNLN